MSWLGFLNCLKCLVFPIDIPIPSRTLQWVDYCTMPARYWSNYFLVIRCVRLEVVMLRPLERLQSRWLLMLSNHFRSTLMSYTDRSVQCCFKSNTPIIANKYENNRKTKPEPGYFWQFANPGQDISGKKRIMVTLHPRVHCTSAYSWLHWAFQNLIY